MKPLLLLGAALACACVGACAPRRSADDRFVALAGRALETWRELDPEWATGLGDHRFDDRLTDRSAAGQARRAAFARTTLDSLRALGEAGLSRDNRIDRLILMSRLEAAVYGAETLCDEAWNPLEYDVGEAIHGLLAREFAPPAARLRLVQGRLAQVPARLADARANLVRPPRLHVETAIARNDGAIALIRDDLELLVARAPELRDELAPVRAAAANALTDYGRWLRDDLLPRADGDFRLGDEKYRRRLAYAIESDLTPEQILESAKRDLVATQKEMAELARALHPELLPAAPPAAGLADREVVRAVLDRLAEDRPRDETIVGQARADLAACTAFVREHDLVTVPGDSLQVIVMPEYQRGVAVAYCDWSGPLEPVQRTYFSISPPPRDGTPGRAESFYREYNDAMLQVLTIHEAMPGHFLQGLHANRFRGPTLTRALFPNGAFVEGWAIYAGQLMTDAGYGGPRVRLQDLKMRLRMIINAMLDQGVHLYGMTEQQAMELMTVEGYQEEGEAAGKWRRACLGAAQLSTYYVGSLEMNRLRTEYARRVGGLYFGKERDFHDKLLSFGAPAPRYLRELLGP